ncbi:MAG: glycosyltransferase family 39 protein [Cycloclasticus sp.]
MKARIAQLLASPNDATTNELRTILAATALISLFFSLTQVLADSVINSDGILYVYTASLIQNGEWEAASKAYNWLFYPVVIAGFSTLSGVSLEYSAYILNAFFSTITCLSFVLIIKEFGGKNKAILSFASLIILCYPNFNEYRNMVIRDHGYWGFYLLSCYFFIRAYKHLKLKTVTFLICSLTLATLFRIEGVAFLLILPLILFIRHLSVIKKSSLLIISILAVILVGIFAYNDIHQTINTSGFTKTEQLESAIQTPVTKISTALGITETYINKLSPQGFSNDYAPAILIFIFISILLTEILSSISPLYAIAIFISFVRMRTKLKHLLLKPWCYLISIHIIILCGFLASHYFLAGRYPIALALTLLIPLPFIANWLYQHFKDKKLSANQNKLTKLTIVLFFILSLDGLISTGASKKYLKEAGLWISSLPPDQKLSLYSNNMVVSYYATGQNKNRIKEDSNKTVLNKITRGKLKEFDLLAIQISRKITEEKTTIIESLQTQPLKVFSNKKGDSVLIFRQ